MPAGARWFIDNGPSQSSGATLSGLGVGTHTLRFTAVFGWDAPATKTVTITNGTLTAETGTYVRPQQTGSLTVDISPAAAVAAGARWFVDNGPSQSSGTTLSGLGVGTHTITFTTISGYITPAKKTVTISNNAVTPATGTYVNPTSALTLPLGPVEMFAGDGPQRLLRAPDEGIAPLRLAATTRRE